MYSIYIKCDDIALHLPINPSEITFKYEVSINRYEIIGLGEISEFNSNKLIETNISSFIPDVNTNLITNSRISANTFINSLNNAREEGQVIELIIKRDILDNIALNCYIGTLNVTERGGEVGDVYYDLSLIEWQPHDVQIVNIQQPAPIQIQVPINISGSEYLAMVSAMTGTQLANQNGSNKKSQSEIEMLKARDQARINELNNRAKATSNIIQDDTVTINGKGFTMPNGNVNSTLGTWKTFNNAKGKIVSVCYSNQNPYKVNLLGSANMNFYFTENCITKRYSGGGNGGGGSR